MAYLNTSLFTLRKTKINPNIKFVMELVLTATARSAPPDRPDGGRVESSPPPNESDFKHSLLKAQNEESSGEVAETQPNADLQKLDTTKKTEENEIPSSLAALVNSIPTAFAVVNPNVGATSKNGEAQPALEVEAGLTGVAVGTNVNLEQLKSDFAELNIKDTKSVVTPETDLKTNFKTELGAATLEVSAETSGAGGELSHDANFGSSNSSEESDLPNSNPNIEVVSQNKVSGVDGEKSVEQVGMTKSEREAVVSQVSKRIETLAANGVRHEVRVRMEPAELGTVLMSVQRGLNGTDATLTASDERLGKALHESRQELMVALNAKGMNQVRVEINTSASAGMQSDFMSFSQGNPQDFTHRSDTQSGSAKSGLGFEQDVIEATPVARPRYSAGKLDIEI
jgi:flagellar hook-length control protein FliK